MTTPSNIFGFATCVATFLLTGPGLAQIPQEHPELCGTLNGYVEVPKNITGVRSDGKYDLMVRLASRTAGIEMLGVDQVEQICPVGNNRLLVFGLFDDPKAKIVYLIDGANGAVLDHFIVSDPAISPDQHWLALRIWEPLYSSSPGSEQYYLYDLTKDVAGNKIPGVDYRYVERLGRIMYPATPNHIPFEPDLSRGRGHSFVEGGAFHWAPNSKSVFFLDRTPAGISAILVRINGNDLETYVHPLRRNGCLPGRFRVDFGPEQTGPTSNLRLEFGGTCQTLVLSGSNFKPAPIEIHKPRLRKPSVEDKRR